MKWLTLDWIKAHSRIDFNCEDTLLELYGEAAEEAVLNVCQRTYEDFIDNYGAIPKPIFEASLMLVELSYTQRSPVSQQQMYGQKLELPEPPTREGYTFTGWYKDYNCTLPWDAEKDVIEAEITLYAGWQKNE